MSNLFAVHAITKEANEPITSVANATMLNPVFIISATFAKTIAAKVICDMLYK